MSKTNNETSLMKLSNGFTLIELIVVIAMIAILSAIALPSFSTMIKNNQMTAQVNQLIEAFHFVRTESIKRGVPVSICSSSNKDTCMESEWEKKWIVFTDNNANGEIDTGEEVLRLFESTLKIATIKSLSKDTVVYFPDGSSANQETLTICDNNKLIEPKAVTISSVGRIASSEKTIDNQPLDCS